MSINTTLLRLSTDKLEHLQQNSQTITKYLQSPSPQYRLYIDASAEGIYFILTQKFIGEDDRQWYDLFYTELSLDPKQDLGYGAAYIIPNDSVKRLSAQLQVYTKKKFYKQYMESVAVEDSILHGSQDEFDYLYLHFQNLQEFYAKATKNSEHIVWFFC